MLPTLGPAVAAAPLAVRVAAWTGANVAIMFAVQFVLGAAVALLPHVKPTARAPVLPTRTMLAHDLLGFSVWALPMSLVAAAANTTLSSWSFAAPNPVISLYWAFAWLLLYDAYSYFLHRWMHTSRAAYRLLHAKHHDVAAALDVSTAAYMSAAEGVFSDALPLGVIFAAGLGLTGNFWITLGGVYNSFFIILMGHCGHEVTLRDARNWPLLPLNPWSVLFLECPSAAQPQEHEDHHRYPRTNYAYFFTHWDEWCGTARDTSQLVMTPLALAFAAAWQALLYGAVEAMLRWPAACLAAYVMAYVVVPASAAAAASETLGLPELLGRMLAPLTDAYRRDLGITYAAPGEPGAFKPAAPDSSGRPATCVFGCHPIGMLARGAFHTFAAKGAGSPVAALARVRLAVAPCLLAVPLLREFLLLAGCCPAEPASLRRKLAAGTSLAVTPGGWREGNRYSGTTQLVLAKRHGFVELAAEAGALLVPVLCKGEEGVTGMIQPGSALFNRMLGARPHPVRVVFGEPIAAAEGESVSELHARYTAALLALGKAHGVELAVAE